MKHTPTRKLARPFQVAWLLMALAMCLGSAGCVKRRVQAAPPVIVPVQTEEATPAAPQPEAKPSSTGETSTPAPSLVPPAPKPSPPRRESRSVPPADQPSELQPEPAPPAVAPPQISPRLSVQEQAEAQRRSSEDIALAERNLLLAPEGKQLSVAQRDLVEKIRGFLAQAREAIRASDWVRARTLAQKARVLSIELVNSL